MPTTDDYFHSTSWRDCSIKGLSIEIVMLHNWIFENMNLKWHIAKKGFYDESNNLIAFDPSYHKEIPKILVIERNKFKKFLEEHDLEIFWIIYGNKHIVGTSFHENKNIRFDINGLFWLKDNKLTGDFYKIEIYSNKLKEHMKEFEGETGKNAIWRNKITKRFKKWYEEKFGDN